MPSRSVPEPVRYLGLVLSLAGLYFLAARFGLLLQLPGTNASPVWPPSGIGLVAVLLFGLRAWPGVAVGAFLANLLTLPPTPAGLTAALAIAVGNTLEPVVGFLVLRRLVPSRNPFDRPADVFRFLAATVAAGAVAATVGAASLWATGIIGGGLVARVWFTWWLGDAAGILVLTPAVVCWWRNPRPGLAAGRRLELAALVVVTALTAELTFGGWFPVAVQYLVVIGPMWAAFRFGPREVALLPVLLSVITVTHVWRWAAGPGPGPGVFVPFVSGAAGVNDSLLMLQLFVCAVGVTAVTLAAAVAERARAEGLLRESEVRFRTVFEQAAVGVALIDTATGRFARVNRRYCDLLGYTSAEVARTTFTALTHPDDLPPDLDRMRRLVAGEIADFTLEKRLIRKDGRVVWVNLTVSPTWRPGEPPESHIAVVEDVTARRATEEQLRELNATLERRVEERARALREQEQRFRAIFHAQFQFIGLMAPDGTLLEANRTALAAAGVAEADVIGRPFWDTVWWTHDPAQQARLRGAVRRAAGGERVRFEASHLAADGTPIWVDFSLTPFRGDDGRVTLLIPEGRDITDRKRAEAELRATEERFRVLFEQSSDAHLIFDEADGILDCNPAAVAMLRCRAKSEVLALHPAALSPEFQPDGRRSLEKCVEMDAAARRDGYHRFDWLHRRMDGELFPCEVTLTPVALTGRSALLVVWHDLTERKRAEAALRASEERFRGLFEQATDALFLRGPDRVIVDVNQRACAALGYDRSELVGKSFAVFDPFVPADRLAWADAELAAGRPAVFESRHRRKDGTTFPVEVRIGRIDLDGRAHFLSVARDVTERTRAEAALRASEERFRAFMDHLPLAAWATDGHDRLAIANRFLAGMLDRPAGELIGKSRHDLIDAPSAAAHEAADRRVRESGRPLELEETYVRPDGTTAISYSVKFPVAGADGEALVGGVALDVTAWKRAEAALRESEERFRSAFDAAPIGMALVAPDGKWLRVNPALCGIVGYDEAALLATDFQAITHPDDLDADLGLLREMLAGARAAYQMEKRYFHRRGHVVHVLLSVSLVRDGSGRPLYFVSQVKDITQRKEAELALAARDALLRQFIRHSPAAVAMFDRELRYLQASARWLTDYQLDGHDIIGRSHYDVFPDVPERWRGIHQRVLGGAVERCDEDPFERADGSVVWLQWECQPWRDATGAVGGLIMFTQVITDRKRDEEQVRASLREKEVLLKEIHHRVKNNLQIVSALLDLQSGHTADAGVREMFKESRGRVKSMALIHERLYRSQDMARVDFGEYVRQLADDLYRTYKVSDDEVRLEVDVDFPPVAIDVAIPCGLLLNELISNCFKHAFPDNAPGCVRVSLLRAGPGAAELAVADDGVGFPAGTDFRDTPSFGMQLVNTLVEQLDATIELRTGGGTTFTVRFPVAV